MKEGAPETRKTKSLEQKTGVESQINRLFSERLLAYEPGMVLMPENHPLQNAEGKYLKRRDIQNAFKNLLQEKAGITNGQVTTHLMRYYTDDLFAARGELVVQNKTEKVSQEAFAQADKDLIEEMLAIVKNPMMYGINPELQSTERSKLQYVNGAGEFDNYDTLDGLLAADPAQVPDPFYVSGRLPTSEVIDDACRRLYEKWYPDNTGDAQIARKLIKEKCIDQVIRQLRAVENNVDKEKRSFSQRERGIDAAVQTLTVLMRQLSQQEYMNYYTDMAAQGPYHPEAYYPEDMIRLDSFYRRPPYNLVLESDAPEDKVVKRVGFYRTVYENLSSEEAQKIVEQHDSGDSKFFRDTAGPINSAHAYAKLEFVFRAKGFTHEQVRGSCAAYIAEVVDEMANFEKRYKQLHEDRGEVASVEELRVLNKEIKSMQNNGRGNLRKKLLTRSQSIVAKKDFIDLMPVDSAIDLVTLLEQSESGQEDTETLEQSPFYFDFALLNDPISRIEEFERFEQVVRDYVNTYLHSKGANKAANDNAFIASRDDFNTQLTQLGVTLADGEATIEEKTIRELVDTIKTNGENMVDAIAAHVETDNVEEMVTA